MAEYDVFADIIKRLGEPDHAATITAEQAAMYRDRLPEALVEFWKEHGTGSYLKGAFTICVPEAFSLVVQNIFRNDTQFEANDWNSIGYDLYGNLLCWTNHSNMLNKESIHVDFIGMTVFNPDTWREVDGSRPKRPASSRNFGVGIQMDNAITSEDPLICDNGEDLGTVARRVIGPLGPGEIYGFFPALAFGGEARVENMRRVGVVEHLTFLSQLGPFTLHDLTPPKPGFPYGETISVRQIGPSVP